MGILESILKLFRKKSISNQSQSINSDQSITNQSVWQSQSISNQSLTESLQLGIAAGYTGRSLREIESSLHRIESLMVTKDWFKSEFQDISPQLLENLKIIKQLIEQHETNQQKRFEFIRESLERLEETARKAPEPIRKEILTETEKIRIHLPGKTITPRMQEVINIIREAGEITYEEVANKLDKSPHYIRGLVSDINKIKPCIETFQKPGERKKWLRYIEVEESSNQSSENQFQSTNQS